MNEETVFKKIAKETLDNIYSRLDGEEKQFLSYLVNCFNISCEKREQLQNNWNELKKYLLEDDWSSVNGEIASKLILNKTQELEQVKDE